MKSGIHEISRFKNSKTINSSMGNPTGIKLALDTSEAALPAESGKIYSVELQGLFVFPPDQVIPIKNGKTGSHVRIYSYTKHESGKTVVQYESAPKPEMPLTEFPIEFNWILKLEGGYTLENLLNKSQRYGGNRFLEFDKPKDPNYRDFPVGIPIELWRYSNPDENYDGKPVPLAKVRITEVTVGNDTSKGVYEVLKLFNDEEREILQRNFL